MQSNIPQPYRRALVYVTMLVRVTGVGWVPRMILSKESGFGSVMVKLSISLIGAAVNPTAEQFKTALFCIKREIMHGITVDAVRQARICRYVVKVRKCWCVCRLRI